MSCRRAPAVSFTHRAESLPHIYAVTSLIILCVSKRRPLMHHHTANLLRVGPDEVRYHIGSLEREYYLPAPAEESAVIGFQPLTVQM